MKPVKCFIILGLCLLMGSCPEDLGVKINIGDYDHQLAGWNIIKIMDYQLSLYYYGGYYNKKQAFITVRNGTPESSDPPEWLARGEKSTVPEFFSFIKEFEQKSSNGKSISDIFDGPDSFNVTYDTEYYYPRSITYCSTSTGDFTWMWRIKLTLMEKLEEGHE